MEDEDCSVNEEGQIDVRYRGWTEIDTSIWAFHQQVTSLDLSYNRLQSIPKEISKLRRLTYLNCENNQIESLPETIGRLRALRILKLNENKLSILPDSIGDCLGLTMLYLDGNKIEMLPQSIGNCSSLELLKLGSNKLMDLPISMAQLKDTLHDIDVTNNPGLAIIPEEVRGDSSAIMWIVEFRHDRTMELKVVRQALLEMGKVMTYNNEKIDCNKTKIKALQRKKKDLIIEREDVWVYLQFRDFRRKVHLKAKEVLRQVKTLFDKRNTKIHVSEPEII